MLPDRIAKHIIGAVMIYWPENADQPVIDESYMAPEIDYHPLTLINGIVAATISIILVKRSSIKLSKNMCHHLSVLKRQKVNNKKDERIRISSAGRNSGVGQPGSPRGS